MGSTRRLGADVLAARRAKRVRRIVFEVAFFALLAVFLTGFMFVFYWMIVTSLKLPREVTIYPPAIIFEPTFSNYTNVLEKTPFFLQLRNSLIVAGGAVLLAMLVGLPASYAASRYRMRTLALTILMMRMMPTIVFMLPLFVVYQRIGLIDTHLGLIFSHLILTVPLIVWVMIGFFEDVPPEVEDQARVDGCNRLGVFWRIALPLALPGIAVTTILSFLTSWNNFVFVLILGGARTTTLPLAVFNFMGFEMLDFGGVAAVASLLSMPIVILTIIVQRWLVGGLTLGAIK